jgi:hypothetical protein
VSCSINCILFYKYTDFIVTALPEASFVTCTACEDFDLCIPCHVGLQHGHSPKHAFMPAVESVTLDPLAKVLLTPGRNAHHHAICDGCDKVSTQSSATQSKTDIFSTFTVSVTSVLIVQIGTTAQVVLPMPNLSIQDIGSFPYTSQSAKLVHLTSKRLVTRASTVMVRSVATSHLISLESGTSVLSAMILISVRAVRLVLQTCTTRHILSSSSRLWSAV